MRNGNAEGPEDRDGEVVRATRPAPTPARPDAADRPRAELPPPAPPETMDA
ncbi:hypothetical protein AB0I10_00200 [Streptomyces sp. NPDC050636]|uniref:hypothetical protein n=1 Tax=Streptomyces sp. NPDC050636 TaxID=3154510 RepID=UPI00343B394E